MKAISSSENHFSSTTKTRVTTLRLCSWGLAAWVQRVQQSSEVGTVSRENPSEGLPPHDSKEGGHHLLEEPERRPYMTLTFSRFMDHEMRAHHHFDPEIFREREQKGN